MAIFRPSGKDVMGKEVGGFSKRSRREYAKLKASQEWNKTIQDTDKVKKLASLFERRVAEERKRLGL